MNLLFICTHNRCRSILCEAITNSFNDPRIQAFSAGSQPAGEVHPLSLKHLAAHGISTANLRSQSWDDFADQTIDIAITVCDSAAGESCPLWLGNSPKVHWGLSDPSKLDGSDAEIDAAFNDCIASIQARIKALLALDLEQLSKTELIASLKQIHTIASEGSLI